MRPHTTPARRRASRAGLLTLAASAVCAIAPQIASASTTPTLSISGATGGSTFSAGPVTVTANATTTDQSNPVYSTTCQIDQGAGTTVLGSQQRVQVTGTGVHIVDCWPTAWDGTTGVKQYATVAIDEQQPTITLSGVPTTPNWSNASQTVTATATEPELLSGISSVTCNDGQGHSSTTSGAVGTITLSGSARYNVACYATSGSGIVGSTASQAVWIDNTAPTVTYANSPAQGVWFDAGQPVTINVASPTQLAPLQSLTCDYSGQAIFATGLTQPAPAALHNWSDTVTLPSTGTGTLTCAALDQAGNASAPVTVSQQVDSTAPTGEFTANPTDPSQIVARVADDLSGVSAAEIQYQQNGQWINLPTTLTGGTATAPLPATGISNGTHALQIIVTDQAGNTGTYTTSNTSPAASFTWPVAASDRLTYTVTVHGHDKTPANSTGASTVHLRAGQTVTVSGQLHSTATALTSGAAVTITTSAIHHKTTIYADSTGAWSYTLAAGLTRSVTISTAGQVGIKAAAATLKLDVDGTPKLTYSATVGHTNYPVHSSYHAGQHVLELAYGQTATITGTLTAGGIPLTGQTVQIAGRRVQVNSSGHFRSTLPAGRSRRVSIIYEATKHFSAAAGHISTRVSGGIQLAFNTLHYGLWSIAGAQILGGHAPAGVTVDLYWRPAGQHAWTAVQTSRAFVTGRGGFGKVGIAVPNVRPGAHIQLEARAVVPHSSYHTAYSSIVNETVIG